MAASPSPALTRTSASTRWRNWRSNWRSAPDEAAATCRAGSGNFPNGYHVCEVEINSETEVTRVVLYWVVEDVGVVINKWEASDAEGQALTGSFLDYAMPRAEDFCNVAIEDNTAPRPTNPPGVKGAGEAGTVAVGRGQCHPRCALGARHQAHPCTPFERDTADDLLECRAFSSLSGR
jgi:aerobic carbon-monoxide dehydrogenase large subunit